MAVNKKKIDRMALLGQYIQEFKDFVKQLDLNPIVDYFEMGLKAREFKDYKTGRVLEKNDDIWWGFNHKGYQYTLRRQPRTTQGSNINAILNQILQQEDKK